jgi:hypothetical protein
MAQAPCRHNHSIAFPSHPPAASGTPKRKSTMQTSRLLLTRSIVAVTRRSSCILTWPVVPATRVDDNPVVRIQPQINCFVRHHSSSSSTSGNTADPSPAENVVTTVVVYESPLANVVGKLRGVSLMTAIIGAVGVPILVALKGSIPDVGILAVASTFVTGSLGSTAAIHYIFGPYVYQLERIPVRVCRSSPQPSLSSLPKEEETTKPNVAVEEDKQHHDTSASSLVAETEAIQQQEPATVATSSATTAPAVANLSTASYGGSASPQSPPTTTTTPSQQQCHNKPTLLKATITSVFLRPKYVIFDPTTDVVPYKGLRPMCNLLAKGIPLYVHPGTFWLFCFVVHTNSNPARLCWWFVRRFTRSYFSSHLLASMPYRISSSSLEFVHDNALRKILKLDEMEAKMIAAAGPTKENPDDFL